MPTRTFQYHILKINDIINKNSFSFKKNMIGFVYNTCFLVVILQSIFIQSIFISQVNIRDNLWVFSVSESLVLVFFLFDYFITTYVNRLESLNHKHKRYLYLFHPIALIQLISIFTSISYLILINLDPIILENLYNSSEVILLLFNVVQCVRLIIIFRFTKFTKLFVKVFKTQFGLIIGWFVNMLLIVLLFGFIFYLTVRKEDINLWQSIYYAFILVTTIGLGDISANIHNTAAQVVTVIFGFIGAANYALLTSIIFSGLVVELKMRQESKTVGMLKKHVDRIEDETEAITETISKDSNLNQALKENFKKKHLLDNIDNQIDNEKK